MKLLVVNWLDRENPQAGGAEIHLFAILARLVAVGDRITLVTSGWSGAPSRATIDGIEVLRVGGRHSFALRGRAAVRRLLAHGGYDAVIEDVNKLPLFVPTLTRLPTYAIIPHLFGATAFREASLPVATVVWTMERPMPWIYRRSAVQAISGSTRDELVARGFRAEQIRVILPGVDTEWFCPDPAVGRVPTPTFLYVGRLKRYKGIETLLRALPRVRAVLPEAGVWVAGSGDDRERLERLAASLGLESAVTFYGFVDETTKRDLLRRAWAHVFPSAKEGWGIANIEASACGTPNVVSDRPGLRDSVIDGETGCLVPHGDAAALAAALIRLAEDLTQRVRLAEGGRRFAETLSWDRTAEETRDHLLTTITKGTPG